MFSTIIKAEAWDQSKQKNATHKIVIVQPKPQLAVTPIVRPVIQPIPQNDSSDSSSSSESLTTSSSESILENFACSVIDSIAGIFISDSSSESSDSFIDGSNLDRTMCALKALRDAKK